MSPTDTLPASLSDPTPAMRAVLRQMRGGPLVAERVGPGKVACRLGGCEVELATVAGLIDRGLIVERPAGDEISEYVLTQEAT